MIFILFISFIILLRIGELILSKSNERWLVNNGAVEYGDKHYPFMISLHILFIISLIVEYSSQQTPTYNLLLIIIYVLLNGLKTWVILSLGKYWSTKIYHIQNIPLINKGLYKYFKHPNYAIVIAEIAIIPLAFHLYFTAIAFTIFNTIMLSVRIKEENKALLEYNC